jgi:hypothetical protein
MDLRKAEIFKEIQLLRPTLESAAKLALITAVLLLCFLWGSTPGRGGQTKPAEIDLAPILKKTADYCRMLDASVLDFVCREEVEEKIDASREITNAFNLQRDSNSIGSGSLSGSPRYDFESENRYAYDYQCVRANRVLKEKRILLEINGKKRNLPVAGLQTKSLSYRNPFLCPVNLFSEDLQDSYDFRIAGTDLINDKKVIVVEAARKSDKGSGLLCLSGKAWIDPETAEILKMEWTQNPTEQAEVFSRREKLTGGKLRLTTLAEFKAEKNGFRFPCALTIEEAYLNTRGRAFIRSVTKVDFKNFHFFTVETDVRSR